MPRELFDRALQRLEDNVLALGNMVENALGESVEVLKRQDMAGARRLIAQDRQINEKRFALEDEALTMLATQQPMAVDLRTIAAVLDITHELERMGDYAKGIAKITLLIGHTPRIKPLVDIPLMAAKTREMLRWALEAFVRRDAEMARAIPAADDEVDALYNQVYRELMTFILADPAAIEQANYLLWVAHNLERAADRVTNICERVVFTVTGEMMELDVQDGLRTEGL